MKGFLLAAFLGSFCLLATALTNSTNNVQPRHVRTGRKVDNHYGWNLVWSDEFDRRYRRSPAIDDTKWTALVDCAGGGNNEAQCYTNRGRNVRLDRKGRLRITAREETYSGPALPAGDPNYNPADSSVTKPFTSARIVTKDKFDFRYGRVEVRAILAAGQGVWPAIWMLPSTTDKYGIWPLSGEIDIIEAVNLQSPLNTQNTVEGALHYGMPWPQWKVTYHSVDLPTDPSKRWHVYAVEWEQDEIRFYIDNVHYMTQTSAGWYNYYWQGQDVGFATGLGSAPFDEPFHLILNVAVGGDKPGPPDTSTKGWKAKKGVKQSRMIVDYVRVFECTSPNADGSGCATRNNDEAVVKTDAGAPGTHQYMLFDETTGPVTLELAVDNSENPVSNTLVPGFWQLNEGNVASEILQPNNNNGNGYIWDVQFNGIGNVFLTSNPMENDPTVKQGVKLVGGSGWTINGELSFDMKVQSSSPDYDGTLLVKLDSGYPNLGQLAISVPPADGSWHRVAIRVSDLLANPLGNGVDLDNVLNLVVLENTGPTGSIHVQLQNIRLQCAYNTMPEVWQRDQLCTMQARDSLLKVYKDGNLHPEMYLGLSSSWAATIEQVTFQNEPAFRVVHHDGNDSTVLFIQYQNGGSKNLSEFSGGGMVEFDLFVVSEGPPQAAPMQWFFKVDCFYPCGTGDIPLATMSNQGVQPPVNAWQRYSFSVDLLVERGLDLSRVNTPFVFLPEWGNQNGAEYYLKNIQWVQPS